jgi:hypothetical protein
MYKRLTQHVAYIIDGITIIYVSQVLPFAIVYIFDKFGVNLTV